MRMFSKAAAARLCKGSIGTTSKPESSDYVAAPKISFFSCGL